MQSRCYCISTVTYRMEKKIMSFQIQMKKQNIFTSLYNVGQLLTQLHIHVVKCFLFFLLLYLLIMYQILILCFHIYFLILILYKLTKSLLLNIYIYTFFLFAWNYAKRGQLFMNNLEKNITLPTKLLYR